MYGDKDTFRLSFKAARAPFHLVKYPFTIYGQLVEDNNKDNSDGTKQMCGVGVFGQRHPATGEVVFMHNYKWHPLHLVQHGYSDLLQVAADSYSSLYMEPGCGPMASTLCNAPKNPEVRPLMGFEQKFLRRGRKLLRQLWNKTTYQQWFCTTLPAECRTIQQALNGK